MLHLNFIQKLHSFRGGLEMMYVLVHNEKKTYIVQGCMKCVKLNNVQKMLLNIVVNMIKERKIKNLHVKHWKRKNRSTGGRPVTDGWFNRAMNWAFRESNTRRPNAEASKNPPVPREYVQSGRGSGGGGGGRPPRRNDRRR
eukprot:UN01826